MSASKKEFTYLRAYELERELEINKLQYNENYGFNKNTKRVKSSKEPKK